MNNKYHDMHIITTMLYFIILNMISNGLKTTIHYQLGIEN